MIIQIFVISPIIEISIESNYWLGMYVLNIIKDILNSSRFFTVVFEFWWFKEKLC